MSDGLLRLLLEIHFAFVVLQFAALLLGKLVLLISNSDPRMSLTVIDNPIGSILNSDEQDKIRLATVICNRHESG